MRYPHSPPHPIAAFVALAALGCAAACTPAGHRHQPTSTTTEFSTRTITRPATTIHTTPTPTLRPPTGPLPQVGVVTKKGACPYLDTKTAQNMNGSRINAAKNKIITTVPIGCRFYALNAAGYGQKGAAGRPEVEISTARYRTPVDAQQGMVRTALKGTSVNPVQVLGHEGAQFRTRFNPTDGDQDWACTFVTGTIVVTVKTDRTDLAFNAVKIATAIAPKFD